MTQREKYKLEFAILISPTSHRNFANAEPLRAVDNMPLVGIIYYYLSYILNPDC